MSKSKIEWTEHTWNPIVGCKKVSPGCANCYAETMAKRLKAMGNSNYYSVVNEPKWTGHRGWTGHSVCVGSQPPKTPSVVFVCSMSDIFFEAASDSIIQDVYDVFKQYRQHTFLVLTKRPERIVPVLYDSGYLKKGESLDNVWHGTSVENQEWADRRIPDLLTLKRYGAWKIFVSVEPLLSSFDLFDLDPWLIDQVLVGCESGPHRRECRHEWVRAIIHQGKAAGVPVFVKQIPIGGKVNKNPDEWPEDLRVRELAWSK